MLVFFQTGEMEVKNPLFSEDTPVTPSNNDLDSQGHKWAGGEGHAPLTPAAAAEHFCDWQTHLIDDNRDLCYQGNRPVAVVLSTMTTALLL